MKNITNDEIQKLAMTKSKYEWGMVCDGIKKARNGSYPDDWFHRIVLSGFMGRVSLGWDCN